MVVDADLLNVPDEALLSMSAKVLATMVSGRVVYQREGFALK